MKKSEFLAKSSILFCTLLLSTIFIGCGKVNNVDNATGQDTLSPLVSSTFPPKTATGVALNLKPTATFSEAIDPTTITSSSYTVTGPNASPVSGSVHYAVEGTAATFIPANSFVANTIYTATINTTVKDLAGNALKSNYVWTFTTGAIADVTSPTVNSAMPSDSATAVATNFAPYIIFDKPLDPATITSATFKITGPGSLPIAGTVTYKGQTAIFTPTNAFATGTKYTATVSGGSAGVKDLSGNSLAANHVWSFTTGAATAKGPALVNLGTAGNYVLLAKSGISSTGTTAIVGNVGITPAVQTYITGFSETLDATNTFATSNIVTGRIYAADMAAPTPANMTTAMSDVEIAFTDAAGRTLPNFTELHAGNISGKTLEPGLYKWSSDLLINTDVTLSGGQSDVWIFQIAGGITQASGAKVILAGGAKSSNVFWQSSGIVQIGTSSHFEGVVLSQTAITLNTGATVKGRLFAQTAITLDANTVTQP